MCVCVCMLGVVAVNIKKKNPEKSWGETFT